ncbi:MAG: FAD binding domain-containing protein [Candidatus Dormibacteraeota bacterium]|nr:FAD binding domain-containing protein [Candidatus Dormibacteraeota bacterium]
MKAAPFLYRRPASLDGALELLWQHGDEAKVLAGGQSLIPLMAMRLAQPAVIVDIADLPELRLRQGLAVGAAVTNSEIEGDCDDLPPIVAAALPHIGHFQIRNRGTIGGSLAHLDPAGEWPALALLLEVKLSLRSRRGERVLSAEQFMRGPLTTAIEPDELLTTITFPADQPAGAAFGFAEVARRPGDFALAGAACIIRGGRRRVVVFGTGGMPQLLRDGQGLESITATGDVHASAAYRRAVCGRLVTRVLAQAQAQAQVEAGE